MEKLELKHLVPYLLYELKAVSERSKYLLSHSNLDENGVVTIDSIMATKSGYKSIGYSWENAHESNDGASNSQTWNAHDLKPILRPMSDLTKEIEFDNASGKITMLEEFQKHEDVYLDEENNLCRKPDGSQKVWCIDHLPYSSIQKLFEWHFDVFGLIDKGLASDINTLNSD